MTDAAHPHDYERNAMTVARYDDNTWAVYDTAGKVLRYGFFTSQDAWDWSESADAVA